MMSFAMRCFYLGYDAYDFSGYWELYAELKKLESDDMHENPKD